MRAELPRTASEPAGSEEAAFDDRADEELVPQGNPARPKSALVAGLAALGLLGFMAKEGHSELSVPLGAVLVAVATLALLDALGCFDDAAPASSSVSLRALMRPFAQACAALVALVLALRLAVQGVLPAPVLSAGVLVTGTSAWLIFSGFRLREAVCAHNPKNQGRGLEEVGPRPIWQREGAWLLLIGVLLYVPLLGSYSLFDPWEAHYGEVAREMLARDDWLSLWWAQENWFWSKPALDFWLQGLCFLLFGVHYAPGAMLSQVADGRTPAPEWAARAPIVALSLVAIYLAYRATTKTAGRRAGLLAGLVLLTTPYWFLISHQSMTDMPYAAPLTAALCLVWLGFTSDPEACVARHEIRCGTRSFKISGAHVVLALVIGSVLPQLTYLLSRNVTLALSGAHAGLHFHADHFFFGSGGGNCGTPGNDACQPAQPQNTLFQPALSALLFASLLGLFLWQSRAERRLQRIYFLGAWYFVALAALAKGAPGLLLPPLIALVSLCAAKRFRDIARIELVALALIVGTLTLPWYVQCFMRHGSAFTDRLLFYDMYKRAFEHVHDTNAGDDVSFRYYLWQLGYGLFPWVGIAASALVCAFGARDEAHDREREFRAFLVLWCVIAFSMFSVSLTKFHHYVLPAVPPIALLSGLVLERWLGESRGGELKHQALAWLAWLGCGAFAVLGALSVMPGSLFGEKWGKELPASSPLLGALALAVAAALFYLGVRLTPLVLDGRGVAEAADFSPAEERTTAEFWATAFGLLSLLSAALLALVGRDLFTNGTVEGQARLIQLFDYNYARPWPDALDFSPALRAFSSVSTLFVGLALLPRLRPYATRAFMGVALCFACFGVDVYLVRSAPHWGQRETILTYYATRAGPEEPLVAYQMNWKGENFYTGNRVAVFVSSGQKFKNWIASQRENGTRVIYFTTEHLRLEGLKSELGKVRSFHVLTKPELNNKFFLARVEL